MKKYNIIIPTGIGAFIANRNDMGVGWQLSEYGAYDRVEMEFLKLLLGFLRSERPDLIVIDVGANIGMHSVVFSPQVGPNGKVFAFEAQRIVFNMLAGNMALNSISNVYCFHHAVSDGDGFIDIPQFDYGKPLNIGSIEFGDEQKEPIGQDRIVDKAHQEQVMAVTLDGCGFDHVDLIKIDVEGMEVKVLEGAKALIQRCKPLMLVEHLKSNASALKDWLQEAGYTLYSGVGANYVCLPEALEIKIGNKMGNLTRLTPKT
jgi:FkbM family methyltransferase